MSLDLDNYDEMGLNLERADSLIQIMRSYLQCEMDARTPGCAANAWVLLDQIQEKLSLAITHSQELIKYQKPA